MWKIYIKEKQYIQNFQKRLSTLNGIKADWALQKKRVVNLETAIETIQNETEKKKLKRDQQDITEL